MSHAPISLLALSPIISKLIVFKFLFQGLSLEDIPPLRGVQIVDLLWN